MRAFWPWRGALAAVTLDGVPENLATAFATAAGFFLSFMLAA